MTSLIERTPMAQEFCDDIERSIAAYKFFPNEHFASTSQAVMATTGTDSHGESFGLEQLERFLGE